MEVFRLFLVLTCAVLLTTRCVSVEVHYVGGSKDGWKPGFMNYTSAWATHEHFHVGDWLFFGFNKSFYNVLEVNWRDYQMCSSDHPISNVSRGTGRDVFFLNQPKPYYFLSSGGYCWLGMKLAVFVQEVAAPTPTPAAPATPRLTLAPTLAPAPAPSSNGGSPSEIFPGGIYKSFIAIGIILVVFMK